MPASQVAPLAHRRNSFDAIRLIAAFMVLVGHAYVLTGAGPAPRIAGVPIHTLGVCVFFAISGYLIAGSWQRAPSASRYLRNRALRIFPALILVVGVTVFLIGPAVTVLPVSGYFEHSSTWEYLVNVTLLGQYDLPGVFDSAEHARAAVNGSLWTLGVEFCCYLALLAVLALLPRGRSGLLIVVAVAAGAAALLAPALPAMVAVGPALQMVAFFFVAAAMRMSVPADWFRPLPAACAVAGWMAVAVLTPAATWPAAWLLLSYGAIGLGAANLPVLRRAGRFGDFSYGLYLWAYPVQQVVVGSFEVDSVAANIAVVGVVSLLLAAASWHLVEKRALALKGSPVLQRPTAAATRPV